MTRDYIGELEKRNEAAHRLEAALAAATAAASELASARAAVERAREQVEALGRVEVEAEFEDEPAWLPENVKRLVEIVEKGPHRPRARSEAESEKLRRQQARTDAALVQDAVASFFSTARTDAALVQDAVASFFSTAPPIPGKTISAGRRCRRFLGIFGHEPRSRSRGARRSSRNAELPP